MNSTWSPAARQLLYPMYLQGQWSPLRGGCGADYRDRPCAREGIDDISCLCWLHENCSLRTQEDTEASFWLETVGNETSHFAVYVFACRCLLLPKKDLLLCFGLGLLNQRLRVSMVIYVPGMQPRLGHELKKCMRSLPRVLAFPRISDLGV